MAGLNYRIQPHAGGTTAGEDTKDHFFPKAGIAALMPNSSKFSQTGAYLFAPF
jgi:hypothetical protein